LDSVGYEETPMFSYIKSLFSELPNKKEGDSRRIEEFTTLFGLEIYTCIAGVTCTPLWYFIAYSIDPNVGTSGIYFFLIGLSFAAILFFGIFCLLRLKSALDDGGSDAEGNHPLDRAVRRRIVGLTISNTIVFGFLVWITGGALSALLPLYAMTFTLTISETKAPYPTTMTFVFFAIVLVAACSSYWVFDLVPKQVLANIYNTKSFYFIFVILSFASLGVPYTALLFSWYNSPHKNSRSAQNTIAGVKADNG
jgi:hypothetical protein